MTKRLYLADLSGMTEFEVKKHIAEDYAGTADSFASDGEVKELQAKLESYEILVAYESVGSFGCDSSSWFLMRDKRDNKLYETQGGHCSCYGFEGQFDPTEAPIEYLQSDKFWLGCGGYDDDAEKHKEQVKQYLAKELTP